MPFIPDRGIGKAPWLNATFAVISGLVIWAVTTHSSIVYPYNVVPTGLTYTVAWGVILYALRVQEHWFVQVLYYPFKELRSYLNYKKLLRLKHLTREGIITQEEFDTQRTALIK